MKLYHGTNQIIHSIDLSRGYNHKDFGKGFYLTPDKSTAERMAVKRSKIEGGEPTLMIYEFDEEILNNTNIKNKIFKVDKDWLEFINLNRDTKYKHKRHDFDIVIGPIANDGVAYLLGRWNEGTLPINEVLSQLRGKFLDIQYYFGTERAINFLKLLSWEIL